MQRNLDKLDSFVAIGLAAVVSLWAFVWAAPYPHPSLWPFLAAFEYRLPLGALSLLGKVGLGAFAALAYLCLRSAWIRSRDGEDVLPDKFFCTRFCPLCGAAIFALSSRVWNAAQYLSPGFALLLVAVFGFLLWQRGCGYRNLGYSSIAYALLAFVAGVHPLGLTAFAYAAGRDILRRWRCEQGRDVEDVDKLARLRCEIERRYTVFFGLFGFGLAVWFGAAFFRDGTLPTGNLSVVSDWWRGWLAAAMGLYRSSGALMLAICVGLAASSIVLGRRFRKVGVGPFVIVPFASVFGLVAIVFFLRTTDSGERARLALLRDYVRVVLEDSSGAQWLFTDGRLDDALRYEAKRLRRNLVVLNVLTPPKSDEAERLRTLAPELGDRRLFEVGGAEVFKAWVRERPDRLAMTVWQLGTSVVRRFGTIDVRTRGSVMCPAEADTQAKDAESDRRFVRLTDEVLDVVRRPAPYGLLFGSVDREVARRFDALVWRAARMAAERSEAAEKADDAKTAESERQTARNLDGANETLRSMGNAIERLLPTANLVLTSREALGVALKRADFALAQRYAREVIVSSPDDDSALFALGMASLEAGDAKSGAAYLEHALQTRPNEPATLNNLSLAYLKLDRLDDALATSEKALKLKPNSAEIKRNLAAIRAKMSAEPAKAPAAEK